MAKVVLRVEIELEGDVSPMVLDSEMGSQLKWIRDSIMSHQYEHDGIIFADWDDPHPVTLSITVKELKDG